MDEFSLLGAIQVCLDKKSRRSVKDDNHIVSQESIEESTKTEDEVKPKGHEQLFGGKRQQKNDGDRVAGRINASDRRTVHVSYLE